MEEMKGKVARVFYEYNLIYVCDEANNYLDTRGPSFGSKAGAFRHAIASGYTHAVGSACPWSGVKRIPKKYYWKDEHGVSMGYVPSLGRERKK